MACSVTCFMILGVRRIFIGGELGGPRASAYASAVILVFLWFLYVILSIIKALDSLKKKKATIKEMMS